MGCFMTVSPVCLLRFVLWASFSTALGEQARQLGDDLEVRQCLADHQSVRPRST